MQPFQATATSTQRTRLDRPSIANVPATSDLAPPRHSSRDGHHRPSPRVFQTPDAPKARERRHHTLHEGQKLDPSEPRGRAGIESRDHDKARLRNLAPLKRIWTPDENEVPEIWPLLESLCCENVVRSQFPEGIPSPPPGSSRAASVASRDIIIIDGDSSESEDNDGDGPTSGSDDSSDGDDGDETHEAGAARTKWTWTRHNQRRTTAMKLEPRQTTTCSE